MGYAAGYKPAKAVLK